MTSEEKAAEAADSFEVLEAYVAAGFTREEALQILCRVNVHVTEQRYVPPDTLQFYERQNALATKLLVDLED